MKRIKIARGEAPPSQIASTAIVEPKVGSFACFTAGNFVVEKMGSFDQDYEIVNKIGEGTFGTVFRVRHKKLNIFRALKSIKIFTNKANSSFQEISILRQLDHPNILKIYEFYQTSDTYYIVTQICQGKELLDEIFRLNFLTQALAAQIIQEVLRAVCYTHNLGIAHRDIKPQNILVTGLQSNLKIKVIDWGLGTLIGPKGAERVCGTAQYCAPEIFKGKYDLSCDLWSTGVVTFVMLTGQMPFSGKNTQSTIGQAKKGLISVESTAFQSLSNEAKNFILSLTQIDPKKRPSAEKALCHPWFKKFQDSSQKPQFLKETLQKLQTLHLQNSLGTAVMSFINNHFATPVERERLQKIFKYLDKNGDGVLSQVELKVAYSELYGSAIGEQLAAQIMPKIDFNQNGTIQFSEFLAFTLKQNQTNRIEQLKVAFNLFDKDQNGKISGEQISKILNGRFGTLKREEIDSIISQIDNNSDGQIDFQQFTKCVLELTKKVEKPKNKTSIKTPPKNTKDNQSAPKKKIESLIKNNRDQKKQKIGCATRRSLRLKTLQK